ncbi:hypothetical protein AAMO2058_000200100 [Amorphochlora amoebiformis]
MSEGFKANPKELDGVSDLSELLYLDMPNVVHNLKYRYNEKKIYTGISSILIALNPYESLACYGKKEMEKYSSKPKHAKCEPHVYNVAEDAYRVLVKTGDNQSMVVCGESGAGKSESAKHLMRHLAYTTSKTGGSASAEERKNLEKKVLSILAANPILEAFGNAKTVLNNNSSRFGKFTKLLFSDSKGSSNIVGSAIETFLLEKSRVVFQTKGERNYHVFYQIMYGADKELKERLGVEKGPRAFYFTSQSGCDTVEGIPDKDRYDEFISSLTLAGFSDDDIDGIQRIVAGILHLSNVKFTIDEKDVCFVDGSTKGAMQKAAELLGVGPEAMEKTLTLRTLKIGGQMIQKPYNVETATINRDSMCKSLFSRMFDWVVATINNVMFVGNASQLKWIGILDVFGFECFAYNSFEQLCINLANERLQQFFNVHVIKSEQEEYEREAIYWEAVNVPDNQACLDLILKKTTGLLALLDSACNTPKATHETFTQILFKEYKKHVSVKQVRTLPGTKGRSKVRINGFTIAHYAKDVCYDAKEFLKKNVDSVHEDTMNLFSDTSLETSHTIMHQIEQSPDGKKKKGKARKKVLSVSGGFAKQLKQLMKALESTRPFFIRCVKPNLAKKDSLWVDKLVTSQLEAGGLIQALKIIKDGFPTRVGYKTIFSKYSKVLQNPPPDMNERDFVEALIIAFKFNRSQFVLGLTKAFFKSDHQDFVTSLLNPKTALSADVVNGIMKHLIRKKILRSMAVVKAVSRWIVMEKQRRTRSAVFSIQALAKAVVARQKVLNAKAAMGNEYKSSMAAIYALPEEARKIIGVVCSQAAAWLGAVSTQKLPSGLEFLSAIATGSLLVDALVFLGCPVVGYPNATVASSAARDNIREFLHGCKQLGLRKAYICSVEDLFLMKDPRKVLDTILNIALITKTKLEMLPTVEFELSETRKRIKGLAFLAKGGVLTNMTEDRKNELFKPGYIKAKRKREEEERKKKLALERKLLKEKEAKERKEQEEKELAIKLAKEQEAERKAAAIKAKEEAEALKAKEEKDRAMAAAASAAQESAKMRVLSAARKMRRESKGTSDISADATSAVTSLPMLDAVTELQTPTVKSSKPRTGTRGMDREGGGETKQVDESDENVSGDRSTTDMLDKKLKRIHEHQKSLQSVHSKVEDERQKLSQVENNLKQVKSDHSRKKSKQEIEKDQKELKSFIKKSKPFVSMLVTLLRKYSTTGMLEEVGLTWRDFPPMTLFETAEKQGIPPMKWSEWIWDFVNERIHTERNKAQFPHWFSVIKRAEGQLDLSYGSVTTNVCIEMCKALIGVYRPKILSQILGGDAMRRRSAIVAEPPKKKGFFGSKKQEKKEEKDNLVYLKLSCNYIQGIAMTEVADLIMQVISIEELWLCGNPIGDRGIESLCFGMQQACLALQSSSQPPLINRMYLQSCSITDIGHEVMARFLETYEYPLVVFMEGNHFSEGKPTSLASKGARPFEKHALTIPGTVGKLKTDHINIIIKYYERILKNPKSAKWRVVSLARACRYSEKKDQPAAREWWAANLLANGFQKNPKSKKGDEYILADAKKCSWEGISWSLDIAKQYQVEFNEIEEAALTFNLFLDLLVRVGTPYTGTIEKEHIFAELKDNPQVRRALKLNRVDFAKFQERFQNVDKTKGGLMRVRAFVEYAAVFKNTLETFHKIFSQYADDKGEVEKQALFKAMQRDQNVRKFFGFKKFHYKQFNDLFKSLTGGRHKNSMSVQNLMDFTVGNRNRKASKEFKKNVSMELDEAIPPMQVAKRLAVKIRLPNGTYMTMPAFSDWTIAKLREKVNSKMITRKDTPMKSYSLLIEEHAIMDESVNLWTLCFRHLKSFPKLLDLSIVSTDFEPGWYNVLVRTNMRKDIDVSSAKIVTIEKGDLVKVVKIEVDTSSNAVRGLVEPAKEFVLGERVMYKCQEIKKDISSRIVGTSPLMVQIIDSRSVPGELRKKIHTLEDEKLISKPSGWISMKSSTGQVCVVRQ